MYYNAKKSEGEPSLKKCNRTCTKSGPWLYLKKQTQNQATDSSPRAVGRPDISLSPCAFLTRHLYSPFLPIRVGSVGSKKSWQGSAQVTVLCQYVLANLSIHLPSSTSPPPHTLQIERTVLASVSTILFQIYSWWGHFGGGYIRAPVKYFIVLGPQ